MTKVHIMAFGAHPDDVELGVGGMLAKHASKGQQIAIVDITEGELGTRGSVEQRYKESAKAAEILGVQHRVNLQVRDGFVSSSEENKMKIINVIRQYCPTIIILPARRDRHPDHGASHNLVRDSAFLAGLINIKTDLPAFRPKLMLSYAQERWIEPDMFVDITETFELKRQAIAAYSTQFYQKNDENLPKTLISTENFWHGIEARDRTYGRRMGTGFAEGLCVEDKVGISDLDNLFIPELS